MRKLLFVFIVCVLAAAASYGEDALIVPESKLRISLNQGLGYVDGGLLASTGIGAEYGISHWLNLQLLWNPGFKYEPELGFSSIFMGVKSYLLGDGALVYAGEKFRLSAALGMLFPPYGGPDLMDQDQMLWGTALRIYNDFQFGEHFFVNLYCEGVFYPEQYTNNNVFYGDWVSHTLDLTQELELHFEFTLKNKVLLRFGAPVRFFYAPYMNASDEYATNQYCLSAGTYFGIVTPNRYPVEIYLKYNAHILGQNIKQVHRCGIVIKVTTGALKARAKNSENVENSESEINGEE